MMMQRPGQQQQGPRMGGPMGGPGNPMGMGKSKAQIQMIPDTGVNFEDVAGCDGAKLELAEVVDFLKQPEVYSKLAPGRRTGCFPTTPSPLTSCMRPSLSVIFQ